LAEDPVALPWLSCGRGGLRRAEAVRLGRGLVTSGSASLLSAGDAGCAAEAALSVAVSAAATGTAAGAAAASDSSAGVDDAGAAGSVSFSGSCLLLSFL